MQRLRLDGTALVVAVVLTVTVRGVYAGAGNSSKNVFFSGYGELHYNAASDDVAELDFHRLVLGFGYQFNDRISLHAELDFEHAFTEPELEFAYLDFFFKEAVSIRAGAVLVPVGPLNEFHEPPLFYSVERPYTQKFVLPTTWQEPGAGILGTLADGSLGYRFYAIGGLDASKFRAQDGIRGGRQKSAEARAEDLAVVGRIEYSPLLGVTIGTSGYYGGAAQGADSLGDAAVGLVEVDGLINLAGVEIRGVLAGVFVDGADSISANNGDGGTVGERMFGWYGQVAYHLLRRLSNTTAQDLVLFARFEQFDTQQEVPDGFLRDPKNDRQVVTVGGSYLPVPEVAIKADFEFWESGDGASWEQMNLGVTFMY
jgi:hypothetical protein